jgi:4-hydroxymandelate oxidase
VSEQKRYHADAELATVRGASAGKAAVVVSSRSSVPIEQIAAEAKTPLWYQVWTEADAKAQIQRAVKAGVRALVVTLGATPGAAAQPDWAAIDRLREGLSVPVLVKGITTPAEARLAVQHGMQGIVVSSWGRASQSALILALASMVDAVEGKVPVLIDGSFRLGADIYKALAFGAQGVLIARPAMWALAAYGAAGVQKMVELLQTELAQMMSGCSNPNIKSIDRHFVKVHATAFP